MVTNVIYPQRAYINAISQGSDPVTSVVTFTKDHDFTTGHIVSFRVTPDFGMHQINNKVGKVLSVTNDTITVDIDSSTWDSFDYSKANDLGTTPPQCVPCCSGVIPGTDPARINIKDAFDNRRSS